MSKKYIQNISFWKFSELPTYTTYLYSLIWSPLAGAQMLGRIVRMSTLTSIQSETHPVQVQAQMFTRRSFLHSSLFLLDLHRDPVVVLQRPDDQPRDLALLQAVPASSP